MLELKQFHLHPWEISDDLNLFLLVLQDYIAVKEKYATYLPHTAGRYASKRFRKAQVKPANHWI